TGCAPNALDSRTRTADPPMLACSALRIEKFGKPLGVFGTPAVAAAAQVPTQVRVPARCSVFVANAAVGATASVAAAAPAPASIRRLLKVVRATTVRSSRRGRAGLLSDAAVAHHHPVCLADI